MLKVLVILIIHRLRKCTGAGNYLICTAGDPDTFVSLNSNVIWFIDLNKLYLYSF